MPVKTGVPLQKDNIWVAAGEGDLARVTELIENESVSPNAKDHNTYTPIHAAASYGHIHILEYLISKGGDTNIKDDDDETPLFVVESTAVARWLIEHGADATCVNKDGHTAAQYLAEEFPEVAIYLQSLDPSAPSITTTTEQLPQYLAEQAVSSLADSVMEDSQAIIRRAEAEGRDPEEELRELVGKVVLDSIIAGSALAQNNRDDSDQAAGSYSTTDTKRVKHDDDKH